METRLDRDCMLGHGPTEEVLAPVDDQLFGSGAAYAIARCRRCGLLHTVPRPDPATLEALTARLWVLRAGVVGGGGGWADRLWRAVDGDARFARLEGTGRLLAIGPDSAPALARYRENGFDVTALVPDPEAARRARALGVSVTGGPLDAFAPEEPFDVVALIGALERSADPRALLAEARRLLAPGGALWVSLPNAASAVRTLFAGDWMEWEAPSRVVHFDGPQLRRLLAEAGFEVFAFRAVTPAASVARSVIARLYSHPGRPTPRLGKPWLVAAWAGVLRLLLFPTFMMLNNAGRGEFLVVRARRA